MILILSLAVAILFTAGAYLMLKHDLIRLIIGMVLIGNAAVALHPVAGQGFNLALRDIAGLAELIADASEGAGRYATLAEEHAARRADDQRRIAAFTHGLVELFGWRYPGLGAARGLGLAAFDRLPGAKASFARHTMGIAGRLPRLARGLPLKPGG